MVEQLNGGSEQWTGEDSRSVAGDREVSLSRAYDGTGGDIKSSLILTDYMSSGSRHQHLLLR